MVTLIPIMVFVTFVLLAYALLPQRVGFMDQRLQAYRFSSDKTERSELDKPFSERIIWPVIALVARFVTKASPQQMLDKVIAELEQAGNPMKPVTFMLLRGLSMVALPAVFGLPLLLNHQRVTLLQLATVALAFLIGLRLPIIWLHFKADARKSTIEKSLPDALDLICVCMEAGLAFDASLSKVVQKTKGPLSEEFGRVLQEINLGKLRRDALRDLSRRSGVPDLRSFVAAIVQADQMGISIGDILRVQSDELRVRRRQRAEEQAMKAPVKMLFPLICFIFPAMMIVMLGPAVWAIYTNIIMRMQGL